MTSFFVRISTMRYPIPHMLLDMRLSPTSPGIEEIDVTRAVIGHVLVGHRQRIGTARSALQPVVDDGAGEPPFGARLVVAVGDAARPGTTTSGTLPARSSSRADAGSRTSARIPGDESAASVASARGPSSMSTRTGSGGLLRKAIPSATDRSTGKPNVQNTALGSRMKSRKRASVSSMRAERGFFASVTQASSGEGHEHVLERRVTRREALEAQARRAQVVDEGRQGDVQGLDGRA